MSPISVDINDAAQAYKQQRNDLADHNALLIAANGALQRQVERLSNELKELKGPKNEVDN